MSRIAIIGCGVISRTYAHTISQMPFVELAACVDDDAARRRAEIYDVYLLLAGIVWYRSNELPERERFCRDRLAEWLRTH